MIFPGEIWRPEITCLCFNLQYDLSGHINIKAKAWLLDGALGLLRCWEAWSCVSAGSSGNSNKRARDSSPPHECYTVLIVVNIVVSKATVEQMFTFQLHQLTSEAWASNSSPKTRLQMHPDKSIHSRVHYPKCMESDCRAVNYPAAETLKFSRAEGWRCEDELLDECRSCCGLSSQFMSIIIIMPPSADLPAWTPLRAPAATAPYKHAKGFKWRQWPPTKVSSDESTVYDEVTTPRKFIPLTSIFCTDDNNCTITRFYTHIK